MSPGAVLSVVAALNRTGAPYLLTGSLARNYGRTSGVRFVLTRRRTLTPARRCPFRTVAEAGDECRVDLELQPGAREAD